MRFLGASLTALILCVLLLGLGFGPAEYPLGFVLRAVGRPVLALVTKVSEQRGHVLVSFQYEAEKNHWPTVEVKTGAAAARTVKEGDRLPAHAIGGRSGLARLDDDFGRGSLGFYVTAALAVLLLGWSRFSHRLSWGPALRRDRSLKLPAALSRGVDTAALLGGFTGFGMLQRGLTVWAALPAFCAVGAWAALRLAQRLGFVEFVALAPPGDSPPLLALPASSNEPLRPAAAPARGKTPSLWRLKTPEGWSVLPAVPLAAGALALVAGELQRALLPMRADTFEAFGFRLAGWDLAAWGLFGLALALGLAEFLRAWRGIGDE